MVDCANKQTGPLVTIMLNLLHLLLLLLNNKRNSKLQEMELPPQLNSHLLGTQRPP